MRPIAIAGAGIGGLAAALALSDAGRRVIVYERAPVVGEIGAGLQLSPNACVALRGLGVLEAVQADAVTLDALRIGRGRDGADLARMPLGADMTQRFGAPFLVTLRADLHRALRRRVETLPTISLVLDARLSGWSARDTGLHLAFEKPGMATTEVDALVGADGLHSVVRAGLTEGADAPRHRGTAWRTTIDAARVAPRFREPCSNLWMARGTHLVHYPVARGRLINVIAALDDAGAINHAATDPSGEGDPAVIGARFSTWAKPLRQLIESADRWGQWPLVDRPPLPVWSAGAVTVLGDAAHPMLPFLAQGAAQALEDAVALGSAVAAMPDDLVGAFQLYERQRRPRATRVQAESRRQATLYHLSAPASSLRDLVLRATPPQKLLARYHWLYSHSA